jgi:signal transduction histidine kinase
MKVLVVDDHSSVRRALRQLIELQDGFEVVGEGADGHEAIQLVPKLDPDVVLMDINMPVVNGIEATLKIKASYPNVKVLALTAFADMSLVSAMVRAGASGYLLKGGSATELLESLDAVGHGQGALDKGVTRGVMENVVELHRKEQERADALEELDRMKSEFVSVVSHELKTPLTSIKGGVETLRTGWGSIDDTVKFELLDSIGEQCNRLTRMITHILTVSGIQHGGLGLASNVFSLSIVAEEAVAGLGPRTRGRDVDLEVEPGVLAACDRGRVGDIVTALIENALAFTAGEVRVGVRRRDESALLEVSDDGPGMSQDKLANLLERPFTQADSSTTRPVGGLGLSLYMAKQVLSACGGRLEVRSGVEEGSTFTIVLPGPEETPRDDAPGSTIEVRGGEPVDIYQCPECELRFTNASEMDAHIKSDHPRFHERWSSADDYLASEAHRRRRERARGRQPPRE